MMPQKKNPHALDIIKSMCGYVIGLPAIEFSLHRMCTSSDLDATFSRSSIKMGGEKTGYALEIFCGVVATMKLNKDLMREQAGAHWATTVNLADMLTRHTDISFRDSHKVCGRFVRLALSLNVTPQNERFYLLCVQFLSDIDKISG
jgi:argininosuccinate lyase